MKIVLAFIALFAGSALWSSPANAIPITYTYVGPNFDQPTTPAGLTRITSTFTVDLGPNLGGDLVEPLSWSISDGLNSIDQSSPDYRLYTDSFYTDASARIVGMLLNVIWFPNTPDHHLAVGTNASQAFAFGVGEFDAAYTDYCTAVLPLTCVVHRTISSEPGSLSAISVPEPGALSLLAAGLLGLAFRRRSSAA
jgi:hypothetical protein